MVINATFNNISVISWRSVLLVVETRVTEKKVTDKLYHKKETITYDVGNPGPDLGKAQKL